MDNKYLYTLIGILVLAVIIQYISYNSLKVLNEDIIKGKNAKIEQLTNEKNELEAEYAKLAIEFEKLKETNFELERNYNSLNISYSELNSSYSNLMNNYSNLSFSYSELKKETESLISKIDEYGKKIDESMKWFANNAELSNMANSEKTTLKSDLEYECLDIEYDNCKIKTACLPLVNDVFHGLRYLQDISTYGKTDKLASLDEFIQNKGGDCEDYSLFYKAELNSLFSECKGKKIEIEAFVESPGSEKYFVNNRNNWYLKDVRPITVINERNIYPSVVCYLTEPKLGHCVIALSQYPINKTQDISNLNGAELVEPQDGSYVGMIRNEFTMPTGYKLGINQIMIVITDNDLYSYDEENGKWIGYSDFKNEINGMKQRIYSLVQ
jgi:predicted nuclease with TOPRIM domain